MLIPLLEKFIPSPWLKRKNIINELSFKTEIIHVFTKRAISKLSYNNASNIYIDIKTVNIECRKMLTQSIQNNNESICMLWLQLKIYIHVQKLGQDTQNKMAVARVVDF